MYAPFSSLAFVVPLLAAGLCASIIAHLWQRREELGVAWLIALAGSVGVLNTGAAWGSLLAREAMILDLARFSAVMAITAALAWLGFALAYSGLATHTVKGSWVAAMSLLGGGLGLAVVLSGSELLVSGVTPVSGFAGRVRWLLEPGAGSGLALWLGSSGLGLATLIILTHLGQSPGHWPQRLAVLAAPILLGAGVALTRSGEGVALFGAEPLPIAAALATAAVCHVLIGDQPVGAEPVARSTVVEEMKDPVLVLGRDGSIVDLNRSARDQLGLELRGPLPFEVATLWATSWDSRERGVTPPPSRLELDLVYGTRAVFELTMTPLGPRAGRNRTVLVLRDITERERMEQELRRASESLRFLANTDGLTGLTNRRRFEERLHEEVERAQRYGRPLALVLLDLDHFKTVNDTWGHPAGDRVLRGTSDTIQSVLREMDVAGRIGGEELAVLLPETDEAGALALAERLRAEIKEAVHRSEHQRPGHVSARLGGPWSGVGEEHDAHTLLSIADQALYEAKVGGRDRVVSKQVAAPVGADRLTVSCGVLR